MVGMIEVVQKKVHTCFSCKYFFLYLFISLCLLVTRPVTCLVTFLFVEIKKVNNFIVGSQGFLLSETCPLPSCLGAVEVREVRADVSLASSGQ